MKAVSPQRGCTVDPQKPMVVLWQSGGRGDGDRDGGVREGALGAAAGGKAARAQSHHSVSARAQLTALEGYLALSSK